MTFARCTFALFDNSLSPGAMDKSYMLHTDSVKVMKLPMDSVSILVWVSQFCWVGMTKLEGIFAFHSGIHNFVPYRHFGTDAY